MVQPSSCTPCDCVQPNMSDTYFYQAAILLLCEIAEGGGGGGGGNVNLTGINGVAPAVGNGASSTGVLRVAVADGSELATEATLAALNTKVTAVNTGAVVIASGAITTLGAITPGTGATNLGKAEDDPSASGDVGIATLFKRQDTAATQTSAAGDYHVPVGNQFGVTLVDINAGFQASSANGLLKSEDAVSATGDAGVFGLSVRRDTATSLVNAEGDYIGDVNNAYGAKLIVINRTFQGVSDADLLLKAEDSSAASGDAGVAVWGVIRSTPAINAGVGDYAEIPISGQGALWMTPTPSVGGGWSKVKYANQTTTVQTVKGTAGTLGGYYFFNGSAATAYVQIFDVASATTVTLGTTVPDLTIGIPAGAACNVEFSNGVLFSLGMKLACTTTATGSGAPATGLDLNVYYK